MPFNPSPTGYFPNINVAQVVGGVTGVFIPWDDLIRFDVNSSGDIRQFFYSVNERMYQGYSNVSSSGLSSKMNVQRNASFTSNTVLRRKYTNTFDLSFSSGYIGNVAYETGLPYPPVVSPYSGDET